MILFQFFDPLFYIHHTVDEVPDPADFSMHAHDRLELYFFIRGNALCRVEGTEYPLQADDIMLMREAETHKLVVQPDAPYERIAIHFTKELLHSVDPELRLLRPFCDRPLGKQNQYHMDAAPDGFWKECINKLIAGPDQPAAFRTRLISYLLPLLQELSALCCSADQGCDAPEAGAVRLVSYINQHLYEPLTLDLLSRQFYMSKSQLNRIFRQATGSTIAHYIEIKRLLAARQMIRTGQPVEQVCRRTGFRDYSNFYRAYKRQFFCTPLQDKNTDQPR